jgi:hypothetical protein
MGLNKVWRIKLGKGQKRKTRTLGRLDLTTTKGVPIHQVISLDFE